MASRQVSGAGLKARDLPSSRPLSIFAGTDLQHFQLERLQEGGGIGKMMGRPP
jgi:hypothetical protein